MQLLEIVESLDREFSVALHPENLVEWAVDDRNRGCVCQRFLDRRTGLVLVGSQEVTRARTAVFVTEVVARKVAREGNCLLFTHHAFDYSEDARGLQPVSAAVLEQLRATGNSVYVAHAPLDTHPRYGTSRALARLHGITVDGMFYDYFGAPTAVVGHVARTPTETFAARAKEALERPCITLVQRRPYVERVAVVAGGGDMPDLLQSAHDLGCDTLLTGTVEHRWAAPFVQEANRKFHELNRSLGLNLISGTHFATERPAMMAVTGLLDALGLESAYCEDEVLLAAR